MSLNAQKKFVVDHLYDSLLNAANRFLHQAKNYSISVLRLENPTYAEISAHFREVADLIDFLAQQIDDALTGDKAKEYIACMEGIAKAIEDDDSEALNQFVQHLETRPFL
ncbi:hypothetical protein [Pseudomonas sp. PA27(2017)]|uniref:hypothetical protein n=1 Tax=Pseudomonas sp. PA27(2017) TaxID=1932112 RepID=UPI00095D94E9|nr:hypothetical protein [Pseudomonas sp. PA27(2017)]OLU23891.1 hypothetical protein BVH06_22210 [Pseudomonas sp. PA27(2017)]